MNDAAKTHSEIKFVAVRPDGSVQGPVGNSFDIIKMILINAYRNISFPVAEHLDDEQLWGKLLELGYSIKKAEVRIINDD